MSRYRAHSGTYDQILLFVRSLLSESCCPISVGRPLWREVGVCHLSFSVCSNLERDAKFCSIRASRKISIYFPMLLVNFEECLKRRSNGADYFRRRSTCLMQQQTFSSASDQQPITWLSVTLLPAGPVLLQTGDAMCHCRNSLRRNCLYSWYRWIRGPPLWYSGRSFWTDVPDFLRSSGFGMGSIQPREYNGRVNGAALQLYSRGWVDPVPDPLLLRK
jgi:hypothetical protein